MICFPLFFSSDFLIYTVFPPMPFTVNFILKSFSGCCCQLTALPPRGLLLHDFTLNCLLIHFKQVKNISCGGKTEIYKMSAKPTCLIVASASPQGVSAASFHQCFSLCTSVFNLQTATPGGKPIDFVGVDESTARWVQDFNVKPYATPAKLESIDGARYQALLIPDCPGALNDLAHSGSLHRILTHFISHQKPVCAVGQGVSALCCATEGQRWIFSGYSLTGPSVFELVRRPDFANLPLVVEDFVKDSGGSYTASQEDAVHVVIDRHLITGQNMQSTSLAVNNLILLSSAK